MSSRAVRTGLARSGNIRRRPQRIASLPLFPTLPLPAPGHPVDVRPAAPAVVLREAPRELWIGVHLPRLPVEALGAVATKQATKQGRVAPRAVVELQGQTQYIVTLCERAERLGVRPGMSLAAALALVPGLDTRPKETSREKVLLERLAMRAQRFTPRVSLVPPDGLLLEVKGSLHLFGGVVGLCRAFEAECHAVGVQPLLSLAPVPLAALAGARAGKGFIVTQEAHLVGQLASLPLMSLRWPVEVIERLKQVGVSTVGEVLRLPRAGFARRFGKAQLAMLDRLTGRDADLRTRFQARERFTRRYPLLYDLEHHEAILTTLEPLLQELGAFLQARQCGITRLECLLLHRHAPPTRCVLRLAAPAASARHFAKLFSERLATLSLPESVRTLELRSGSLVPRAPTPEALWQSGEHGGGPCAEAPELIEHLRSRLGHEAVYGLQIVAAHRPETAWAATELTNALANVQTSAQANVQTSAQASDRKPASDRSPWPAFRRPAWLLRVPRLLHEHAGLPRRRGPLQLLSGPERIETAWWDGGDISRDYYVALDVHGVRLWIFRERTPPHRWFLQGVFG